MPTSVFYARSRLMDALLQAVGSESDAIRAALASILDQWFVETATWALDRWERELGITSLPDQPVAERRAQLLSRLRVHARHHPLIH